MNETKSTFDTPEWQATMDARTEIDQAVLKLVRKSAGEAAVRSESMWANSAFTKHVPTPDEGMKAALRLQRAARYATGQFATAARAEGTSWQMIAVILGYKDADDPSLTPAERAFELVAGPSRPFESVSTRWTCSSCGQAVTDRGPFESHPEDNEQGHAGYDGMPGPKCARFKREVAAWRRRNR